MTRSRTVQGFLIIYAIATLLASCNLAVPGVAPVTTRALVPLDTALAAAPAPATAAGYLLRDSAGFRLVGGLSFSAGADPTPIDPPVQQAWIDASAADAALSAGMQPAGDTSYMAVLVTGMFEGPGSYGPGGIVAYYVRDPAIVPLSWQETTIALLVATPDRFEPVPVRVTGALVASASEALLVEAIGPGGLPVPSARQVKLRAPVRDTALLAMLTAAPGGAVRYGKVQIEGVWRNGELVPLSIRIVA